MKKMFKKFSSIWIALILIFSLFEQFIWVNANNDKVSEVTEYYKIIHNANKLASWWIIVDNSSNPENYRLNDSISRWEMAKIVSKISKIEIVDKCEWSYYDLTSWDWECKYAEAWLKNNYFSAGNTYFRPKDSITKIEALKIVMKAKWIEKTDNSDWKKAYVEWWKKAWLINDFTDYDIVAKRAWIFNLSSNNQWNKVMQWDFKAEYVWNEGDYKKSDNINVTIEWKIYKLPWIYNESTIQCIDKTLKEVWELETAYSLCWWIFSRFKEFSPSWYYLLYSYTWWEHWWLNMVDSKTWKEIMSIFYPNFFSWTKDRKQFIYWWEAWMWTDRGLYITIKWSFPKTKMILDEDINAWYIDESNIYIITWNEGKYYKKIIDIKTEKVIYIEEIK
jgi:hypothetical protein